MARRICNRGKPKKRLNRYNPNEPDWMAVHAPYFFMRLMALPTAVAIPKPKIATGEK